jgi:hypothetical protein
MKKWMLFLMAVMFVASQAVAQQTPPQRVTPQAGEIPQIVAYDKEGLLGDHIPGFSDLSVCPVFMRLARPLPMKVLSTQALRSPQSASNASD